MINIQWYPSFHIRHRQATEWAEQTTWVGNGKLFLKAAQGSKLNRRVLALVSNAMKARARDEVGRKQKVFFGRQRFDMLSKGLSAPLERSTTLSIPFGVRQGPEKIALAHARGKQNEETFDKEEITTCYIPSPVRVASNKGGWRTRMRGDAHTPSSDASRSEVLDTLDLSERERQGCSSYNQL